MKGKREKKFICVILRKKNQGEKGKKEKERKDKERKVRKERKRERQRDLVVPIGLLSNVSKYQKMMANYFSLPIFLFFSFSFSPSLPVCPLK